MTEQEKRLLELEFQIKSILEFVTKVANDSETFVLMKKDIEECKNARQNLSEYISNEVDVYMNKPKNRSDLATVIDGRIDSKIEKMSNKIAFKVLGGVTAITTTVLTGVIMLWIK